MANGDGLNYMHKRDTVGIQANTVQKLGDDADGQRWRVFPNEPVSSLAGLKVGTGQPQPRPPVGIALDKKSSERRVAVDLTC
jgi:hypothetical protein